MHRDGQHHRRRGGLVRQQRDRPEQPRAATAARPTPSRRWQRQKRRPTPTLDDLHLQRPSPPRPRSTGGITLKTGQKLIGQGVGLTVGGLPAPSCRPARGRSIGGRPATPSPSVATTANGDRTGVQIRGLNLASTTGNAIDATRPDAQPGGVDDQRQRDHRRRRGGHRRQRPRHDGDAPRSRSTTTPSPADRHRHSTVAAHAPAPSPSRPSTTTSSPATRAARASSSPAGVTFDARRGGALEQVRRRHHGRRRRRQRRRRRRRCADTTSRAAWASPTSTSSPATARALSVGGTGGSRAGGARESRRPLGTIAATGGPALDLSAVASRPAARPPHAAPTARPPASRSPTSPAPFRAGHGQRDHQRHRHRLRHQRRQRRPSPTTARSPTTSASSSRSPARPAAPRASPAPSPTATTVTAADLADQQHRRDGRLLGRPDALDRRQRGLRRDRWRHGRRLRREPCNPAHGRAGQHDHHDDRHRAQRRQHTIGASGLTFRSISANGARERHRAEQHRDYGRSHGQRHRPRGQVGGSNPEHHQPGRQLHQRRQHLADRHELHQCQHDGRRTSRWRHRQQHRQNAAIHLQNVSRWISPIW